MRTPRLRTLAAIGGVVAVLATSLGAAPATAAPLDKGRFHDVLDETFDCNGTRTHQGGDVFGSFTYVKRGRGLAYYRESVRGTVVFTNVATGGTYSNNFTANSRDLKITDNGDGTLTILSQGSGMSRWFDKNGTFVLSDSGMFRFSVVINLNGTPDNPDDDFEVDGSFVLITPRTGRADTADRDFCADLVLFTT